MNHYKYDIEKRILMRNGRNIYEEFDDGDDAFYEFVDHCGELLAKALNEEEMWKLKLKQFADAQGERKRND